MTRLAVLIGAAACSLMVLALPACAETSSSPSGLKIVKRIPGPDGGWDYVSFDPVRRRVYVANGNAVMAIEADTGKMTPRFAAGAGLHAVVPVPGSNLIVTTNGGDATARIIDAADGRLLASVATAKDPDGAIYDPSTGLIMVVGGDSGEVTMVDPKAGTSVGSIVIGGSLEFPAVDGRGKLYVNVASKNEIAVVDIAARKVLSRYSLPGCNGPMGLAMVSGDRLIAGCFNGVAKILDAASGRQIASLKIGPLADAVLYDTRRNLAYIPSGLSGTVAVVALSGPHDNAIIDTVPTQISVRTGAVDPKTGRLYLPAGQFNLPIPAGQRPTIKPGTFEVLVLDRK